jgi:hypothetical protein
MLNAVSSVQAIALVSQDLQYAYQIQPSSSLDHNVPPPPPRVHSAGDFTIAAGNLI